MTKAACGSAACAACNGVGISGGTLGQVDPTPRPWPEGGSGRRNSGTRARLAARVADNKIGIVEKLWARHGSLAEGRFIALQIGGLLANSQQPLVPTQLFVTGGDGAGAGGHGLLSVLLSKLLAERVSPAPLP